MVDGRSRLPTWSCAGVMNFTGPRRGTILRWHVLSIDAGRHAWSIIGINFAPHAVEMEKTVVKRVRRSSPSGCERDSGPPREPASNPAKLRPVLTFPDPIVQSILSTVERPEPVASGDAVCGFF